MLLLACNCLSGTFGKDYDTIGKLKSIGISNWFSDEEKAILKSKPIRKEVRGLTDNEWKKVHTAMNIMKYTDGDIGRSLYGDSFYSYDELVCWHTETASSFEGDMGHGYPHFAVWHRAFMYVFEKSILSIDSSIGAFPYWDYRLDADSPKDSIIFSEKYFGNLMGDNNKDYAIKNGPFAYWPVAFGADVGCRADHVNNIFGLMRSYINPNPSLYVTRIGESLCNNDYNYVGDLVSWNKCLKMKNFVEFNKCYENRVHTGAHIGVGGTTMRKYINKQSMEFEQAMSEVNTQVSKGWCHNWLAGVAVTSDTENKVVRFYSHPRNECFDCDKDTCLLRDETGNVKELSDEQMSECVCKLTSDDGCAIDINTSDLTENNEKQEKREEEEEVSSSYVKTDLNSHLVEHVWGDMFDAISSVNDPVFFFHHINMDRYSMLWQINMNDYKDYYYKYPREGYAYGINLNDTASPVRPFGGNLFDNYGDIRNFLSIADIIDATSFINAPYIYDDIYEAIFHDDSYSVQQEEQIVLAQENEHQQYQHHVNSNNNDYQDLNHDKRLYNENGNVNVGNNTQLIYIIWLIIFFVAMVGLGLFEIQRFKKDNKMSFSDSYEVNTYGSLTV